MISPHEPACVGPAHPKTMELIGAKACGHRSVHGFCFFAPRRWGPSLDDFLNSSNVFARQISRRSCFVLDCALIHLCFGALAD